MYSVFKTNTTYTKGMFYTYSECSITTPQDAENAFSCTKTVGHTRMYTCAHTHMHTHTHTHAPSELWEAVV